MPLPRIKPIRPTWRKDAFDHADWLFDAKYDGFRGICYLERGRNRLISRNGNHFDRFASVADQVAAELGVADAVIDGEVIAADETGRPQFYDLLRGALRPAYIAFDLLWMDGIDLRPMPLSERRRVQSDAGRLGNYCLASQSKGFIERPNSYDVGADPQPIGIKHGVAGCRRFGCLVSTNPPSR